VRQPHGLLLGLHRASGGLRDRVHDLQRRRLMRPLTGVLGPMPRLPT